VRKESATGSMVPDASGCVFVGISVVSAVILPW
jgi:hypothetical protein